MDADERITAEELAYFQATQRTLAEAQAICGHWSRYLCQRYRLGPRDIIHETGLIERIAEE